MMIVDTNIVVLNNNWHLDDSLPRLCEGKSLLRKSADKQQRFVKLIVKEKAHDWFERM